MAFHGADPEVLSDQLGLSRFPGVGAPASDWSLCCIDGSGWAGPRQDGSRKVASGMLNVTGAGMQRLRLAELMAALSLATDLVAGRLACLVVEGERV